MSRGSPYLPLIIYKGDDIINKEIWKDIPDYEGLYQASTFGRVKSLERLMWNGHQFIILKERILKPRYDKKGYVMYALYKNKKRRDYKGHRIIAITFLENKENKQQINHINGIKDDNRVINLEWCTNQENQIHAFKIGLQKRYIGALNPKSKKIIQLDLNKKIIKEFESINDAVRELNLKGSSHISQCCKDKRKTAHGYIWKYKGE